MLNLHNRAGGSRDLRHSGLRLFFGLENPAADGDADFVGVPFGRTVERVGVLGLDGAVGVHVDFAVETISVVVAVHPCPAQKGVDEPALAELVFVAHAQTDHHAVALAIAVLELDASVCQVGLRHVERHHAEVGAQVPAAAVLLEIAAVFAHEDAELHVLAVDGFPRRDHDFGLQGRFG